MFKNLCAGAVGISLPFEETLPLARKAGFQAVDIPIGLVADAMDSGDLQRFKDDLILHGLKAGGWGCPVDWKGEEARWEEGLSHLPRLAKAGRLLNSTWVPTWITPFSDEMTYAEQFDWHLHRLAPIARILREEGCRLGLEFVGTPDIRAGRAHPFIYRQDQCLELCTAIGMGTGLLLDSWHWFTSGGTPADLDRLRPGDVIYVHVNDAPPGVDMEDRKDSDRTLPGETGVIEIVPFLKSLSRIAYDGPVTTEPFLSRLANQPAEQSAMEVGAAMDRIWKLAGL